MGGEEGRAEHGRVHQQIAAGGRMLEFLVGRFGGLFHGRLRSDGWLVAGSMIKSD